MLLMDKNKANRINLDFQRSFHSSESRTRGHVQRCVAGNPGTLRSEAVTFLISFRFWGRKALESIGQ
jgi:hypothetical protein